MIVWTFSLAIYVSPCSYAAFLRGGLSAALGFHLRFERSDERLEQSVEHAHELRQRSADRPHHLGLQLLRRGQRRETIDLVGAEHHRTEQPPAHAEDAARAREV